MRGTHGLTPTMGGAWLAREDVRPGDTAIAANPALFLHSALTTDEQEHCR
jgi:hypothetical protein